MQGLDNLGSTCAINSLIQIICRTDNLRNIILNSNIEENTLTNHLKEILDIMYNQNKSIKPYKFLNYLYKTFSTIFRKHEQIDLYELWLFISNKIIEENSIKPIIISNNNNNDLYNKHDNVIAKYNNYKTCDFLENIQGSFIQIIECLNCNYKHINFEPFISIILDINDLDNNPTIADLLINFLKLENKNSDDWKCDKCNKKSNYTKINKIWKIPKTIILIINRFKDFFNKNQNTIFINDNIVFKKNSLLFNDNDIKFNLKAIGLHDGSLNSGHYSSICKVNDKIYHYNDELVSEIDKNVFDTFIQKNNRCYMIVYELV